jgi:hypothetical protein
MQDVLLNQANKGNALNDSKRSELLRHHTLLRSTGLGKLLWEFVDINIEKITTDLRKHLDYKND